MPTSAILVGAGTRPAHLLPAFANRHGLIAGATGTGKTITLQVLAESLSALGTPVFLADVKGDLAGISQPGAPTPKVAERLRALKLAADGADGFRGCPTVFWDLFGQAGHPVRVAISDVGPLLLARLLDLNEVQTGVLNLAFRVADDEGLLLLDFKDLRAMLVYIAEQARRLTVEYGNVSANSVGAIQRKLLILEQEGATDVFGEPAIDPADLMRVDAGGAGLVSVLAADQLIRRPRVYGTFLVWLLSELFELLPEVGDLDRPRLVLFFDEAHLLFDDAPAALTDKIEQVVRLIRSKGVGVFFVTQNPLDVPERILGQLGNRIQHALRAFTPRDQRAVRAAADTFRQNPRIDTAAAITELGVGEALVSLLDERGMPSVVERALIRPPRSRIGPITPAERAAIQAASPIGRRYDQAIDRDSAYERLRGREAATMAETRSPSGYARPAPPPPPPETLRRPRAPAPSRRAAPQSTAERIVDSVARQVGTQLGRQIVRGLLGSILRR